MHSPFVKNALTKLFVIFLLRAWNHLLFFQIAKLHGGVFLYPEQENALSFSYTGIPHLGHLPISSIPPEPYEPPAPALPYPDPMEEVLY